MKITDNDVINYFDLKKDRNMLIDLNFTTSYPLRKECIYLIDLGHDTFYCKKELKTNLSYDKI